MLRLKSFCFNPFQENTHLLYDDSGTAWIIDPGNSNRDENRELSDFISDRKLRPERLLLTHGHIDHILGNRFLFDAYGLKPEVHRDDLFFVERMKETAAMYGVTCEPSPVPEVFIEEGQELKLGEYDFQCIHTPGHSAGSVSFYNEANKLLICGDVLFAGSIGRTDLPGGDYETLMDSIVKKLIVLGDDVNVYCGHGPSTTIGAERLHNPFLTERV
jgi:hydroxyacylglutathione hydrolase